MRSNFETRKGRCYNMSAFQFSSFEWALITSWRHRVVLKNFSKRLGVPFDCT